MKKVIISIIISVLIIIPNYEVKAANSISCPIDLTEYTFANSKVTMDSDIKTNFSITIQDGTITFSEVTVDAMHMGYFFVIEDGGISSLDYEDRSGTYICPIFYYKMDKHIDTSSGFVPIITYTYTMYTKNSPDKGEALESSTSGFVTDSVTNVRVTYKEWLESNNDDDDDDEPEVIENACEIFGEETTSIIKYVLMLIRIGVPVLIVILTMLDFTKIILNAEDKEYKAAVSKLIKRIGVAVAIIILPIILTLIIEISGVLEQYGIADGDLFCSLF